MKKEFIIVDNTRWRSFFWDGKGWNSSIEDSKRYSRKDVEALRNRLQKETGKIIDVDMCKK